MLRRACLLLVVLLAAAPARAEDEAKPRPRSDREAIDMACKAFDTKDHAGLAALAALDRPEPWVLAELLWLDGRHDVAVAYAKAAPRPDIEKLPAHVASLAGKPVPTKAMEALRASRNNPTRADAEKSLKRLVGLDFGAARVHRARALYLEAGLRRSLSGGGDMKGHGLALARYREARKLGEALGWWGFAASAAFQESKSAYKVGDMAASRAALEIEAGIQEKRGNLSGVAQSLGSIAHYILREASKYREALAMYRTALGFAERAKDLKHALWCRRSIASMHRHLGDFDSALDELAIVQARIAELNRPQDEADLLLERATVHRLQGRFARALELVEQAATLHEERVKPKNDNERLQQIDWRAKVLARRGTLQQELGDYERALKNMRAALALRRSRTSKRGTAAVLVNLGNLHRTRATAYAATRKNAAALAEIAAATEAYNEALKEFGTLGDKGGLATVYEGLGDIRGAHDEHQEALALHLKALALAEEGGEPFRIGSAMIAVARSRAELGQLAEALAGAERAHAYAEARAYRRLQLQALGGISRWRRLLGQHEAALAAARKGIAMLAAKVGTLAEEQGVVAQREWLGFYADGLLAARAMKDDAELFWVLEHHHTGKLLGSIAARRESTTGTVPAALREAHAAAVAEMAAARKTLERMERRRDLRARRQAMEGLRTAQETLLRVTQRVHRERRAGATTAPGVASLADVRAVLTPDEVLVLYFTPIVDAKNEGRHAFALVVTRKDSRVVSLSPRRLFDEATAALELGNDEVDPAAALAALAKLAIEPLKLPTSATRLIVAPHGHLAHVPFDLLVAGRQVSYTPSGTILHHLRTNRVEPTTRAVLALGDPVYQDAAPAGGKRRRSSTLSRLVPLPATRKEVEAIGGVALLGPDATETKLGEQLAARARWRALHFACHGLVDAERPLFSSLAISRDAKSDGFLTCLEILDLRLDVDLVASSACETARGKTYETDGVMGLTRTFMIAGAPRVLCSLWPVDDEASRELMVTFYKHWNPKTGKGLGAAEALARAKAHVRGHEKWKHPYFWAAWVLWGLPE